MEDIRRMEEETQKELDKVSIQIIEHGEDSLTKWSLMVTGFKRRCSTGLSVTKTNINCLEL